MGKAKLCPPAKLYLIISVIATIALGLQNLKKSKEYSAGDYKSPITFHNGYLFLLKVFYILVWTWLLNKFCDWGFTPLSWLLVMAPLLLFFILIGLFMFEAIKRDKAKKLARVAN
jgi:hypothetical protein